MSTLGDIPLGPPASQLPSTSSRMAGGQFPYKGAACPSRAAGGPQWTEDSGILSWRYNPAPTPSSPAEPEIGPVKWGLSEGAGALGSGDEPGPGYTFSRILMFPRHLRLPRNRVTLTALKGHVGHTASDSGLTASPHCRKRQQLTNRLMHSAISPHCSFRC